MWWRDCGLWLPIKLHSSPMATHFPQSPLPGWVGRTFLQARQPNLMWGLKSNLFWLPISQVQFPTPNCWNTDVRSNAYLFMFLNRKKMKKLPLFLSLFLGGIGQKRYHVTMFHLFLSCSIHCSRASNWSKQMGLWKMHKITSGRDKCFSFYCQK